MCDGCNADNDLLKFPAYKNEVVKKVRELVTPQMVIDARLDEVRKFDIDTILKLATPLNTPKKCLEKWHKLERKLTQIKDDVLNSLKSKDVLLNDVNTKEQLDYYRNLVQSHHDGLLCRKLLVARAIPKVIKVLRKKTNNLYFRTGEDFCDAAQNVIFKVELCVVKFKPQLTQNGEYGAFADKIAESAIKTWLSEESNVVKVPRNVNGLLAKNRKKTLKTYEEIANDSTEDETIRNAAAAHNIVFYDVDNEDSSSVFIDNILYKQGRLIDQEQINYNPNDLAQKIIKVAHEIRSASTLSKNQSFVYVLSLPIPGIDVFKKEQNNKKGAKNSENHMLTQEEVALFMFNNQIDDKKTKPMSNQNISKIKKEITNMEFTREMRNNIGQIFRDIGIINQK